MGKVALAHDFLYTYGGAERVLKVLTELYPDAPIYTAFAYPEIVAKHFPTTRIITTSLQRSPLLRKPQFLLTVMPRAVEEHDFSGYDTVISSSGAFSHGIITGADTRHISYCHSPMRYAWDWHAEYLNERGLTGIKRFVIETLMSGIRTWDYIASKRVDVWLANSNVVAKRIKRYYQTEAQVVYPCVDTTFFGAHSVVPASMRGHYAITVSRLTATKRVDLIIEACAKAGLPLQIAGSGTDQQRLESIAASLKADVTFLGGISEDQKREYISKAECFIFATEDDFGIAPVEALACGTPVVAYGKGGVTETVVDGQTGIFFDELSIESLAAALVAFQKNHVPATPEKIRASAERFSNEAFKKAIRRIVE